MSQTPPPANQGHGQQQHAPLPPTAMSKYKVRVVRSPWRQFTALCRKNLIAKKRDRGAVLASILIPLYLVGILLILTAALGAPRKNPALNQFPALTDPASEFCGSSNSPSSKQSADCVHIAYTNKTNVDPVLDQLTKVVTASEDGTGHAVVMRNFASRAAIRSYFEAHPGSVVSAVEFTDVAAVTQFEFPADPAAVTLPSALSLVGYTMYTNFSVLVSPSGAIPSGSVTAQSYVERALINTRRAMFALPPMVAPLAKSSDGTGGQFFSWINTLQPRANAAPALYPFYFTYALYMTWTAIMREVATEKQLRIKSTLAIQGLSSSVYLLATFATQFTTDLPLAVLLTALTTLTPMLPSTSFLVFLVLVILFLITCSLLGLVLSVFVEDPKKAQSLGSAMSIVFIGLYAVGFITTFDGDFLLTGLNKPGFEWLFYLVSPVTFARAIAVLAGREAKVAPTSFSNISTTPLPMLFGFLALDAVLYLVLAWYLDQVFPGQYGQALPYSFPLQPAYWSPRATAKSITATGPAPMAPSHGAGSASAVDAGPTVPLTRMPTTDHFYGAADDAVREPGLESDYTGKHGGRPAVSVRGLTKIYPYTKPDGTKTTKRAVDSLNLDVPSGCVLGMVGKNGQGKSTSIALMTGMIKSDEGTIEVHGMPVSELTLPIIQRQLGLCPQDNVLWPRLTCLEHLQAIAEIRGVVIDDGPGGLDGYLKQLLRDVYLQSRAGDWSEVLSGGMKRKLSVAIALLGSPPIVILDEPTTGMDVYTRRNIWSLIQAARLHSTILLTSHSMEEIEQVSDIVAVVQRGKLRVLGTSLFIKSRYSSGYQFSAERSPSAPFATSALLSLVHQSFPTARIESETPTLVTVHIPSTAPAGASTQEKEAADIAIGKTIATFFRTWGEASARAGLNAANIGLGMVSLEDIFIQLNDGWEKEEDTQ
ncbi:hypothetical protein BC828DRAFT_383245 [Blastocladiella britannica]|nr:hypothetical protein BC828DRAFT_383245 [Blastocladiella britannica]